MYSQDLDDSFKNFPIKKKINFYTSQYFNYFGSKTSSSTVQITIIAAGAVTFVTSPTSALSMYKIIQSLKYLGLINIELPSIVTSFSNNMDVTSRNIFSFVKDTN